MTETKITGRQLMALIFVSLLSPLIRAVPDGEIPIAGRAAWLAPAAAVIPVLALLGLLRIMLKRGEGLGELILKAYGGIAGRAVLMIYVLWLPICTGVVLRVAGERLVSYVYNDSGWMVFAAVILLASIRAALGRVRSLAGTAQIFAPIAGTVLIVVFVFLAGDVEPGNLLPVTYYDIPHILLAGLHLTGTVSVFGFYGFFCGETDSQKARGGIGYTAALLAVAMAVSMSAIGVLSADVAGSMQSPFFVIIRNITLFNVLERAEAVVIALWVISDFVYVASLLAITADLARLVLGSGSKAPWVVAAAVFAMAAAALTAGSAFRLEEIVLRVVPAVNGALAFAVIPVTLLTVTIREHTGGRRSTY